MQMKGEDEDEDKDGKQIPQPIFVWEYFGQIWEDDGIKIVKMQMKGKIKMKLGNKSPNQFLFGYTLVDLERYGNEIVQMKMGTISKYKFCLGISQVDLRR